MGPLSAPPGSPQPAYPSQFDSKESTSSSTAGEAPAVVVVASPLAPSLSFLRPGTFTFSVDLLLPQGRSGGEYERVFKARVDDPATAGRVEALSQGRYRVSCHSERGRFLGTMACEVAFRGAGLLPQVARSSADYRRQGKAPPATVGRINQLRELVARQVQEHAAEITALRQQHAASIAKLEDVHREALATVNAKVTHLQQRWAAHHENIVVSLRQRHAASVGPMRQERDQLLEQVRYLAPIVLELDGERRFLAKLGLEACEVLNWYEATATYQRTGPARSYFTAKSHFTPEDRRTVQEIIARLSQ